MEAVEVASVCTRADSTNTIPSCAIIRPQNSAPFAMMTPMTAGEWATNQATAAVVARPPHIQAYTPLRNVLARSATGHDENRSLDPAYGVGPKVFRSSGLITTLSIAARTTV